MPAHGLAALFVPLFLTRPHLGERADADGRTLLHNLTAWKLWPHPALDE